MSDKILQVKNLQVSFRTQGGILKAVRNISFDLEKGETLAIVGESGSGKSVTSKAIIGILAGNSIVEGGEILYDGQDLLKINEESFHKIRGDKISMIFQDPLSSLNPIMRVGKQITEAMILNGKARQKSARHEFNGKLEVLNKYLNIVNEDKETNKQLCDTLNAFCVVATKLERSFNDASSAIISLKNFVHETSFFLSKNQKVKNSKIKKGIFKYLDKCVDTYLIHEDDEFITHTTEITKKLGKLKKPELIKFLNDIENKLNELSKKQAPNFFRLGYYVYKNPNFDGSNMNVDELDEMCLDFLMKDFMSNFIEVGSKAVEYSFKESINKKKDAIKTLNEFKQAVEKSVKLKDHKVKKLLKITKKNASDSINYLAVKKATVEYSYGISIQHEFDRYANGLKINPGNNRRYNRKLNKFNKLIENGKTPTWRVIPPYLVDLDLTRTNILKIIDSLIRKYEADIADVNKFVAKDEMVALIDFMKEQASRFVYTVTKDIARSKALDLLKEVGIPEPEIRYHQYPFEFSGGMRQRIVIAIALSANPDILICDEPTTALDVTIQSQILELINKIKVERKLSIIFITHDLGVVANMADKIAVMYAGKIVEYGNSSDVFYDPKHPYTWALLASMPDLETKDKLEAIPGTPPNMIYPPVGDAFADRNKYALKIDYEKEPPMFEVSPTHYAATWLLHPNAPKVNPPKSVTDRIKRMKGAK